MRVVVEIIRPGYRRDREKLVISYVKQAAVSHGRGFPGAAAGLRRFRVPNRQLNEGSMRAPADLFLEVPGHRLAGNLPQPAALQQTQAQPLVVVPPDEETGPLL